MQFVIFVLRRKIIADFPQRSHTQKRWQQAKKKRQS